MKNGEPSGSRDADGMQFGGRAGSTASVEGRAERSAQGGFGRGRGFMLIWDGAGAVGSGQWAVVGAAVGAARPLRNAFGEHWCRGPGGQAQDVLSGPLSALCRCWVLGAGEQKKQQGTLHFTSSHHHGLHTISRFTDAASLPGPLGNRTAASVPKRHSPC